MNEKAEVKKEESSRIQTSPVWSYFKVCEDNAVMADCLLCGVRMSRGGSAPNRCGTTNLRRHVLYTHNITLPSAMRRTTIDGSSKKTLRNKPVKKSPVIKKGSKKTNHGLKKRSAQAEKNYNEQENHSSVSQPEPVMCIKWNTYLSNMTSALPHLLQDEQFVDVTLACEGQSLKCHKILLAACSPYFYELLSTAGCRHPIIMFKDYHFWELQALVAFMYCGEVNVPQSQLPRILRVAEALQIKGLAKPTSKVNSPPENESDVNDPEPAETEPLPCVSKRKRKPSSHSCCKTLTKTAKTKHKPAAIVKSRAKLKSVKRKITKRKLSSGKKCSAQKERPRDPWEQKCAQLPELLPSMPDMLTDILGTAEIMEGISLPEAHKVGSMDSIFPLQDLEGIKMDMDEVGPFLANGLHNVDQFNLLPHISPECRLDEDEEDGR